MVDPPKLSEPTKRKLSIRWDTLRDIHKLTHQDLVNYDVERRRAAAQWESIRGQPHYDGKRKHLSQIVLSIGLDSSIRAAEARFRHIDHEYWLHWCSGGLRYEVYRNWLGSAEQQVLGELGSVWKGRSSVTDRWFQGACVPAVQKALAGLVKQRIAQARDVETQRLERASSRTRTGTGNPIADEILARGSDPESMRRLIESGDNSLSPLAQKAVQLARTRMKAESPDALIDIYISDQWRIHGGPREKRAREELRDRLIPVVIKAFGSIESSLDVLLKESPCSNGHRIDSLIRAYELYFLRIIREAVEARDKAREQRFADLPRQFHELDEYEQNLFGTVEPQDNERIHATLRTSVCNLPSLCPVVSTLLDPFQQDVSTRLLDQSPAAESAQMLHPPEAQGPKKGRNAKKPARRNQKYKVIDKALQEIAEGRPSTQEDVFQSLDGRHVVIPTAEPFMAARGWIVGFRKNPAGARAWLSKRWAELNLSPLPRGPKKPKK